MNSGKRVLISTIAPGTGGVATMTGFVVDMLRDAGYEPTLAHYEPYSVTPDFSVPMNRLLQRRIDQQARESYGGCETHAIGAWLPEFEFTHYAATKPWQRLMDETDHCVSVSGNILTATPFLQAGRPYLSWVATDWLGDRRERSAQFPWPRKLVDKLVASPVIQRLERRGLQNGLILALSEHTRSVLNEIAQPRSIERILRMPIESDKFRPSRTAVLKGRIGFAGRINDPRKNMALLFHAIARIGKQNGSDITLVLIGESPNKTLCTLIDKLNIKANVQFEPRLSRDRIVGLLQTFDLFVISSHQEGLCISALEAMACGCPVISTRCGGPEEFVLDDETGYLVNFDADEIANRVAMVCEDRAKRDRLSANARSFVEKNYNTRKAGEIFWSAFEQSSSISRHATKGI